MLEIRLKPSHLFSRFRLLAMGSLLELTQLKNLDILTYTAQAARSKKKYNFQNCIKEKKTDK